MPEDKLDPPTEPHGIRVPPPAHDHIASVPVVKPVMTAAPALRESKPPTEHKDNTREIIETVVFVIVLVLLLKTFVAEAFVIPTGSMAPTLLGYHRKVTCDKCGYHFLLNASSEVDPPRPDDRQPVIGGFCPNCRAYNEVQAPAIQQQEGPLP